MANTKLKLGTAVKDTDGTLHGRIGSLGLGSVDFIGQEATSQDGKSYIKLIADPAGDAYEIGAAFPREKDGLSYYSVNLESPVFPAPLNAALFPDRSDTDQFNLVWSRPDTAPSAEATATASQPQHRRYTGAQATP